MGPAWLPHDSVRYFKMYLVDSVLPAPDSPETMMDWERPVVFISLYALSAIVVGWSVIGWNVIGGREKIIIRKMRTG